MNCKRSAVLAGIIILFLIFGIFLVNSAQDNKNKVSEEVYSAVEKNDEVRVVIKIEVEREEGIFIKKEKTEDKISLEKQETKEEIINNVGEENVKHVFDEEIAAEISEKELESLNKNPNVESVIIDRPIHAFLQDSVPFINASKVWPIQINSVNITGIDETICILDTGINFSHPDLIGKNKTCVINCITEDCAENCSLGDDNGHGTHVAGIVAASGGINGVAISANLIGVKVLDSSGSGTGTDLNAGIDWCIANSAAYNISVISMSLGDCSNHDTYCNSDSSTSFIDNATAYNISVIAAAGNCNPAQCPGVSCAAGPSAPACVQNAIAVGAVNDADSSISYQRGVLFELLAPGININSTKNDGTYFQQSGTSMAAPHVAGAFALVRQFYRLQNGRVPTTSEIKSLLNNTGKQINDSSGTGLNYSRIDIYTAVDSLMILNTNFVSPANNTYTNQNQTNFTCLSQTSSRFNLNNITFYLWNSTSNLVYNITTNISGASNSTIFNYNFSYENYYKWGCLGFNNNSNSSWTYTNYTITYDITNPIISSVSSSVSTTTAAITWTTDENSNSSVNYGTTTDLGSINSSSILTTNHSISLSSLSSSTIYYYNITNCDNSGNCAINGTYNFTTSSSPPVQQTSDGGGGGGALTSKTYTITTEQVLAGYTQILSKNDKIKFTFFDETAIAHTLTINDITSNSANLTIQSSAIKLILGIGQSAKLNLTSANYYNFYIKLNSITNKKADITIQTIHEQIPKPSVTGNVAKDEGKTVEKKTEEIPPQKQTNIWSYIKDILIVILIIAVLVILFSKKDKIRQERIKDYRKKFRELKPKR